MLGILVTVSVSVAIFLGLAFLVYMYRKDPNVKIVSFTIVSVSLSVTIIAAIIYAMILVKKLHDTDDVGRSEGYVDVAYPWMSTTTLESHRSLYHKIDVVDTRKSTLGTCLLLNDEVQFCSKEQRSYHELLVHFPVQYLNKLKHVLIVGGGDCMALEEVMKYPDVHVTILELDDMVTRVSEKHFDANRYADSKNVTWVYGKIMASVKSLLVTPKKYDLIIVDTTETTEHNAETDKADFFQEMLVLLAKDGVVVKNGDGTHLLMRDTFINTLSYGYNSVTHSGRYSFVLGSSVDFKTYTISTSRWSVADLTSYNPERHYDYVKWSDTFKKSFADSLKVSKIDVTTEELDAMRLAKEKEYAMPVEVKR
jgi:spermidine synthase